jgi:hypothetical protein
MEIIDEPSLEVGLKQGALVQLKNIIRNKWKPKKDKVGELTEAEKAKIRSAVVVAIIRCAQCHMLIKLYREILTILISYDF